MHAAVRVLTAASPSLDDLTKQVNRYLVTATEDNRFATFAVVRVAPDGAVAAVNAGHCPIVIRRRDGTIERIESSGLPLGILAAAGYEEVSTRLDPGDLVLLYTDGLTEAEDQNEDEFGVERVERVLTELAEPAAEAACSELMRAVEAFVQGRPLQDDATLLVLERLAEPR